MLLTKKELKEILKNMRISIPKSVKKEVMDQYGNYETDDEGHIYEYTEQDIYEQLRKKLRPYEKSCICDFVISADAKLM
jgi:hypothetical protein